jgi:hypothetical protein
MYGAPPTVGEVLYSLIRHPIEHLVRRWNWKAATLSAGCRATIFFAVNLPAGMGAGLRAMATEMAFRVVASGALGSATQAFRRATPPAAAMITALVVVPAAGHLAEYAVHRMAGTVRLGESIAVSIAFSMLTTAFNLFAMRRGALIVGDGQQSLADDVRRLPALIVAFVRTIVGDVRRVVTRRRRNGDTCLLRR